MGHAAAALVLRVRSVLQVGGEALAALVFRFAMGLDLPDDLILKAGVDDAFFRESVSEALS